ncbi:phage holin family protein [Litoribacter populi]|uniref:phage holin family protein n=1 Tax=Litoribacter populi TaxID=2598460 RepID=UPI0011809647|nr:phage holin family protein [Litoribacter populi]
MLNFSEITNTIKNIFEVRFQIVKEELKEEFSTLISRVAVLAAMGFVGLLILFFLSVSLAFYFGALFANTALGFLAVGGIFILIFIILFVIKDSQKVQFSVKRVVNKFVFLFQTKTTTHPDE